MEKNTLFKTSLIGKIQIKNLMFAIAAAYLSKLKIEKILKSIHKIKPITGRFEKIGNLKNNSKVILDYAHTQCIKNRNIRYKRRISIK